MQPSAGLHAHLLDLCAGDADAGERLAAELTNLAGAVNAAVPSAVSMTLALVRDGVEIAVAVAATAEPGQPARSSLAGAFPAGEPGALLIVRAADANAFGLRDDHKDPWLGLDAAHVQVDQHLAPTLLEPEASLALALIELQSINKGLGVLIELGYDPIAAPSELARRADVVGTTRAAASEALIADVCAAHDSPDP